MPLSDLSPGRCRCLCARIESACRVFPYTGHDVHLHGLALADASAGTSVTPHQHSYYEAMVIVSGRGFETTGMRQALVPGTIQMHVPGSVHGWAAPDAPMQRFGISFSLAPSLALRPLAGWPVCPQAVSELRALLAEAGSRAPGTVERLRARLLLLLSRALDLLAWPTREPVRDTVGSWPISERVEQFLCDNLDQPLTLADVAAATGFSVPTLARRFREATGQSVIGRFCGLRMEHAWRLLETTDLLVKEIAFRVGFAEPSYFCRCFRQHFRRSPASVRSSRSGS